MNKPPYGGMRGSINEFSIGYHLIKLRRGEAIDSRFHNQYLFKAKKLMDLLFTLPEYHHRKGQIFDKPGLPMIMEIGCYMGDTLVEMAVKAPDINFLGIDIKYKRVVKSTQKIIRNNLPNVKILMADARELMEIISDRSIQGIVAFFPDPWQKHKQQKHRFLNNHFFRTAINKLRPGGFIWVKTDDKPYMEDVQKLATSLGYHTADDPPDLFINPHHQTFFENLFIREKQSIYQLVLKKI